jgi:glycosyltransferase involved in cell wall biosynthesis
MKIAPRDSDSLIRAEPVYVESSSLLSRNLTGIGRYVARMVEAMVRMVPVRLVTTVTEEQARASKLLTSLVCGHEVELVPGQVPSADDDVGVWVRQLLRRPQRTHDFQEARRHAGIYPALRPAERHFGREICLLHDYTPAILPWTHLPSTCEHFGAFFTQTSGLCDWAIANSRSTQADARWLSNLAPEKVIHAAPGPTLCIEKHSAAPIERIKNKVLVVSTLEPRKNGTFLFNWFMNTDVLADGTELCWAGPRGWLSERLERAPVGKHGRKVRFLGMISDQELCREYQTAEFTIYPSLYEGFGFPVLDSLLHGTPVLCSFNSSLQEFAGPGVFYFDPYDPSSLDDAYLDLQALGRPEIDRDQLRERYSWENHARTVLKACA